MMRRYLLLCALLAVATLGVAEAQPQFQTRDVVDSLDTPWEILWGPDDWIWMTERGGRISRVDPETGEQQVLVRIADVHEQSESGLLGMALHPSFADTPFVYVVYNYSNGGGIAEKLVRYRYDGAALVEPTILLQSIPGYPTHNGSRLLVTPDRKLLMTTGDAQNQPGAQNHMMIVGKTLRLNLDGSAPADNPWPGAPSPANLLWTTGHRNAQGLAWGPNGILYSSEHGPNNDDEINILERARNYGWPNVHGYCNTSAEQAFCSDSNVVEPIRAWTPTLAVAGLEYYPHTAIAEFANALLVTTLKESDLRVLRMSADGRQVTSEQTYLNGVYGRLRDITISPDGRVFIATSNRDGRAPANFPKRADDRIVELSAIAQSPTITLLTVSPMTVRGGMPITVSFGVSGPAFDPSNVFTVEMSDSTGSFDAPRVLGTVSGASGGTVTATLPCDMPRGDQYRVRVRSSAPETSAVREYVIVMPTDAPLVTPSLPAICAGDSITLGVSGGTNIRWSPADGLSCTDCVAPVARPTATTEYTVSLTNTWSCEVSTRVIVTVNPLPTPVIVRNGDVLSVEGSYASYQWLSNGGNVPSILPTLTLTNNGTYTVRVTDSNGCVGMATPIVISDVGGIVDEARDRDLRIAPSPARERIAIELALGRSADVRVELIDMRGALVRTMSVESSGGTARAALDLRAVPAGAYVVRVTSGAETWVRTVVKE
jgi:glucose/arabinose dehydrogenase